jgi:hypothetical protein
MAWSLQAQVRTELVLHGPDLAALKTCARRRFGSAAPVRIATTPAEALTAAAANEAVAVIAVGAQDEWAERLAPGLSIFDWIRDEDGKVVAAAVGRIPAEECPDAAVTPRPVPEAGR